LVAEVLAPNLVPFVLDPLVELLLLERDLAFREDRPVDCFLERGAFVYLAGSGLSETLECYTERITLG
jgi:hypothetical protein